MSKFKRVGSVLVALLVAMLFSFGTVLAQAQSQAPAQETKKQEMKETKAVQKKEKAKARKFHKKASKRKAHAKARKPGAAPAPAAPKQ